MSKDNEIAKKDQFDVKKLESIENEIKKNKKKISKAESFKRTNILSNLFIAIFVVIYFAMLLKATINIPAIELITDFKVFIILELICTIVLFEASIKKDSAVFFAFGIEMLLLGISTLAYMNLYSMNYPRIEWFTSLCIAFFTIYYLVKAIVIAIKG